MPEDSLRRDSLILYKNRPGRVVRMGDKIDIEVLRSDSEGNGLETEAFSVRPKDVTLLHPGPVTSLDALTPQQGEVITAWELLQGSQVNLEELAELIYGQASPATAWAAWQLVEDGLYFQGEPQEIRAVPPEAVEQEQASRRAKQAEAEAWERFVARIQAGESPDPETLDEIERHYLEEVEMLALGQRSDSRVMQMLGRAERPEIAHALLLEMGYWDETIHPYPQRLGLPVSDPQAPLPDLREEPRRDLTGLPAYAIDDEGSSDPDDAISLEGRRIWVHVADAAALVPPDSPADLEARGRGANLYLPENTVHMLPPRIVPLLGLGLAEVSPALSFGLDIGADGEIEGLEIVPSWVRVERLTYEEADRRMDEEPFTGLSEITSRYRERRRRNGALFIDLPEVKLRVVDGEVNIQPVLPLESRAMVREAMMMTGEAAARFAIENEIPFPFATQEGPGEPAQEDGPPPGGEAESLAAMIAIRRTLKRSQVSAQPGPHAGVGLPFYSRATSPLRRYMDLVAHQQLRAFLHGEPVLDEQAMLERVGASEAVTGSVNRAEFQARLHWTLVYLRRRPRWSGEGVLVEVRNRRGKVLIPELALEVWVHLRKDWPLDSRLRLKLRGVDLPELEAYFTAGD